jgi:F0F1-type ATP synthase assembly protein I
MGDPLGSHSQKDWQSIGAASGIGCTIVVSLLVCIGGGVLLDRWLDTTPVMVAVMIAAGYALYELAVLGRSDKGLVKLKRPADRDSGESRTGRQ